MVSLYEPFIFCKMVFSIYVDHITMMDAKLGKVFFPFQKSFTCKSVNKLGF